MFFSKTTKGFYLEEIHGENIPQDVIEITEERWSELMDGQSLGKIISTDNAGNPILVEPKAPSYSALRASEYPPISDYLDGVVKGDQAQIDSYIAACQAVKAKYPKGQQ